MTLKMFGMKGKLISAKQRMSRLISLLTKEDNTVSSPTPVPTAAPYEPVNPLTDYSLEAEMKKAEALMYVRMLNRSK